MEPRGSRLCVCTYLALSNVDLESPNREVTLPQKVGGTLENVADYVRPASAWLLSQIAAKIQPYTHKRLKADDIISRNIAAGVKEHVQLP